LDRAARADGKKARWFESLCEYILSCSCCLSTRQLEEGTTCARPRPSATLCGIIPSFTWAHVRLRPTTAYAALHEHLDATTGNQHECQAVESQGAMHDASGECRVSGKCIWHSHLAVTPGSRIWQSYLAITHDNRICKAQLGNASRKRIWHSHPSGATSSVSEKYHKSARAFTPAYPFHPLYTLPNQLPSSSPIGSSLIPWPGWPRCRLHRPPNHYPCVTSHPPPTGVGRPQLDRHRVWSALQCNCSPLYS
jgi:hypothetical protein